jgi:polysaccharide export outer membrane protein
MNSMKCQAKSHTLNTTLILSHYLKPRLFNHLLTRHLCLILILSMACALGCAGPARQLNPEQLAAQSQAQTQKNVLQEQLLAQVGGATLNNYQDYKVGSEDLLDVSFLGLDDLNREVRVNGQGDISLPLVGAVHVAGLTSQEIEGRLRKLYLEGEFLKNPQISVGVKEYRHERVMITGAVKHPGSYEVIGPRTLLEMLGKAGGLDEKAGEMVHVIRAQSAPEIRKTWKGGPLNSFTPGSETIVIDLRRLLAGGDLKLNLPIKNGDCIYVPFAKNAYVLGAVMKPTNVPVKDNITAIQAVAIAGGQHTLLASDRVTVTRLNDQGKPITLTLDLGKVTAGQEADIPLKENDIVFVQESGFRRFLFDFRNLMPGSYSIGSSAAF